MICLYPFGKKGYRYIGVCASIHVIVQILGHDLALISVRVSTLHIKDQLQQSDSII